MKGNRSFRVAATSARVLTGAVVAAACVVGTVVAVTAPWPSVAHEPAQVAVTPLPGDTVLQCNGDFRAIGRDPSNPLQMVSAAAPELTVDGSDGVPESRSLAVEDLVDGGDAPRLTGEVTDRTAPLVGAAESVVLATDDLSGFAAAPCRPAAIESWLVGGTVATGTEDLIVLSNPGAVPSTVTLDVHAEARRSSTVIVPAETQIALPLSSIASGVQLPVVEVTATGAPVRAVLQSSLTRTLDPAGLDLQDAVSGPQQHLVIPGVQVFEFPGDSSEMAVLRLLSPDEDAEAVVSVRQLGESATEEEFTVPLPAGAATELSLSALPPGEYTVHVDSEVPVLGAVREQDGVAAGNDFAWITPAPELTDDVLVAVPQGPAARLILANEQDQDATVEVTSLSGGEPREITVAAGSSAAVEVEADTVYRLSGSDPVHAAVTMTATGALAAWPVWPAAGAQQSVTVYP